MTRHPGCQREAAERLDAVIEYLIAFDPAAAEQLSDALSKLLPADLIDRHMPALTSHQRKLLVC